MDKPTESRGHRSARSKRSNRNPHLNDHQLLLALDGESSNNEAAQVEAHLRACWSCRARRDQIEKAISDVVEYRNHLLKPYFPIPTGGRSIFLARLEQFARTAGRPSLWNRLVRAFRVSDLVAQDAVRRHAWATGFAAASLALFLYLHLWAIPKVSASQLLVSAQASEVRALQSVAKPVVYQRLRIQIGSQVVTRTMYRDLIGKRQSDRLEAADGYRELPGRVGLPGQSQDQPKSERIEETELRRTFSAAHLNWQDPLSPGSYSAWHDSLGEKQDEVTTAGDDFITLKTTTSEGAIAEARITLRTSDFHPVAEDILLQDTREVEVSELAWEVLPIDTINQAIFAPETTQSPDFRRSANLVSRSPGVTDAELAEAELQARVAIHAEKADLGEQIELDRGIQVSGQRSLVIRGIVNTLERKNDLQTVLRGIPHVEFRLQTVEEAEAQQTQVAATTAADKATQIPQEAMVHGDGTAEGSQATEVKTRAIVVPDRTAFAQKIEEHIPIAEERTAFINETVELLQDAMVQVWALRRLSNRYTPPMVAELGSGSRQTLELLIRDHVTAIRQYVDDVRSRVAPLLPTTPVSAMLSPMPDAPSSTSETARDWRNTVNEVFSETKRLHDNGAALLAGPGDAASEAQAIDELQLALDELKTQLPTLYQQVNAPFLSESKENDR